PFSRLKEFGDDDGVATEVAACLATLAMFNWDWQAALALVPAVPDTSPGPSLLIRCAALAMAGRPADARNLLTAARPDTAPTGGDVLNGLARGFVGAWSDDLHQAKAGLAEIAGHPAGFWGVVRPTAQWLLADVHYRLGAFDDALAAAELARSILQDSGRAHSPAATAAHAIAAYAASAQGDWARAQQHVAAAQARVTPTASRLERASASAAHWSLAVARDDPQQMMQAAHALEEAANVPELSIFPFGPVLAEAL